MNLTAKQKLILGLIAAGNPHAQPIDFDQLIDRLPYNPSKESMHFSLRALIKKGLVEKGGLDLRRGRSRRLILATPLGEHWAKLVCPRPAAFDPSEVEAEGNLADLAELDESFELEPLHP